MAIRTAYALGLHKEETLVIFSPEEQNVRRNVWRSLFIADCFLSFGLGRPLAISEEDTLSGTLQQHQDPSTLVDDYSQLNAYGLEANVRSCIAIGTILRKVYSQRKIGTRQAQEIAGRTGVGGPTRKCKSELNLVVHRHYKGMAQSSGT